jgi:hypothetical protein
MEDALGAFCGDRGLNPYPAGWLFLAGWTAAVLWDEATWLLLTERQLSRARETGELTAVPPALGSRSIILAMCGELSSAASMVDELRAVTRASGIALLRTRRCGFPRSVDTSQSSKLSILVAESACSRTPGRATPGGSTLSHRCPTRARRGRRGGLCESGKPPAQSRSLTRD